MLTPFPWGQAPASGGGRCWGLERRAEQAAEFDVALGSKHSVVIVEDRDWSGWVLTTHLESAVTETCCYVSYRSFYFLQSLLSFLFVLVPPFGLRYAEG